MKNLFKLTTVYYLVLITILSVGLLLRLIIFDKVGGDYETYKIALDIFNKGQNPYFTTIDTFTKGTGEHGYAYLPALLYIQNIIWLVANFWGILISTVILWKIPVLVAEYAILFLIFSEAKKSTGKENLFIQILKLLVAFFWILNPYFIARYDYSLYDPLFLLSTFTALRYLETNSKYAGIFYTLAVCLKTIPLILLPLFILKTKNYKVFIVSCVVTFIVISLPFMTTYNDITSYIKGSLLVHSERGVQGRPLLTFITYYLFDFGIDFKQHTYTEIYSILALIAAFVVPTLLYLLKKLNNKYSWVLMSTAIYLVLTPVLSRTHILWFLPWLFVVILNRSYISTKRFFAQSIFLIFLWLGLFGYMYNWNKGFEGALDNNGKPVLKVQKVEWELTRLVKHRYYEFRGKILEMN